MSSEDIISRMAKDKPYIESLKQYHPEITESLKNILYIDKKEKYEKWHQLLNDPIFFPI
jgi:hypothetical protein